MQICFRCDNATNVLLETQAHIYGISKNRLMNIIVQEYLGQNTDYPKASPTSKTEKEILPELRQANETLARLLADTNDFYFNSFLKHTPQESNESFRLFRTELIGQLTGISDRLGQIRKDMVP